MLSFRPLLNDTVRQTGAILLHFDEGPACHCRHDLHADQLVELTAWQEFLARCSREEFARVVLDAPDRVAPGHGLACREILPIAGSAKSGHNGGMRYSGTVIRPPSEADSYLLQVTLGCSHNRCTFCGTYLDKPFRVRPIEEVLEDIAMAAERLPDTRRVFLCDGNALVLSTQRLVRILDALNAAFPLLRRVGVYANARDLLSKSDAELASLNQKKLEIIYLGLESGSDEVLRRVAKRATAAEMVEGVEKARQAGMRVSVIALLGIGGRELSGQHAEQTARIVSAMDPQYFSLLTLMLVPGTELYRQWQSGAFQVMKPVELLVELREVLLHLDGLSRCVFRTNHASNYLPLAGTLSRDKERLLAILDRGLSQGPSALRPEAWRAL